MEKRIKLLIADDHLLFVDGLVRLLKDHKQIGEINVTTDGKKLIYMLEKHQANLILLDINMPNLNGLAALEHLRKLNSIVRIIMLSTYGEKHLVEKAKATGANGYLLKNVDKNELFSAIDKVMQGASIFPNVHNQSTAIFEEDLFPKQFNLTKREHEIIQLIKANHSNQQMAEKLFLSIYTIETHRKNIMQKLGLSSPAQLIKFIITNDL